LTNLEDTGPMALDIE